MDEAFLKKMPLSAYEQYTLQEEILKGVFGPSGVPFMTTQQLAAERMVSLVTAHHIMKGLQEAGYIELRGKKYYLCYDRLPAASKRKPRLLGLILPTMNNEFYSSLADRITGPALESGYRVLTVTTGYSPEEERHIRTLFRELSVSGIISCVPAAKENLSLYQDCELPQVVLGHSVDCANCTTVQVNSFSISRKVADHLADAGYRHFLYVGSRNVSPDRDTRYMGFQSGLTARGFSLGPSGLIRISAGDEDSRGRLMRAVTELSEPTGIFCNNDLLASLLYEVCRECGKRIPEDVGVVGFDDLSISRVLSPALSTVHYRLTTMADMALQQLFRRIDDPRTGSDNIFIEPTLVVRGSSTPEMPR